MTDAPPESTPAESRTFVLLPGAGGAAWYWHRVVPLLERAGHEALAIDLPGADERAGLAEYRDLTVTATGDRSDVVLVAQSMGAFTAAMVAQAAPIAELVLVNPMIPLPGERPTDWWGNAESEPARIAAAERHGYRATFDLDVYFFHDIAPELTATMMAHDQPETDAAFVARCEFDVWPDVPIRVAAGADDRFFPVELQQRIARERLGVTADVLPGGHLNALSQPEAVAEYLLRR